MSAYNPPMGFDSVSTDATLDDFLGGIWYTADKGFRLVKAAANLSVATPLAVVTALSSGDPTYAVNTSTTAADHLAVGVAQTSITTISSTANQIDSGSYFFVQCAGIGKTYSAGAFSAGDDVFISGTAGKVDDAGSVASLTDNSGGTASDTLADVTEANNAGSADRVPTENAIASLAAKVNALLNQGAVDGNSRLGVALEAATGANETIDTWFKGLA